MPDPSERITRNLLQAIDNPPDSLFIAGVEYPIVDDDKPAISFTVDGYSTMNDGEFTEVVREGLATGTIFAGATIVAPNGLLVEGQSVRLEQVLPHLAFMRESERWCLSTSRTTGSRSTC